MWRQTSKIDPDDLKKKKQHSSMTINMENPVKFEPINNGKLTLFADHHTVQGVC